MNSVFHGLARHNSKLKEDNAFSNLNKELNSLKSPRPDEVYSEPGSTSTPSSAFGKKRSNAMKPHLRGMVLRRMSISSKDENISGVINKRSKMDMLYVISVKQFSDCLVHIFKDRDMGKVYKEAH